jgi:hypothetical protein
MIKDDVKSITVLKELKEFIIPLTEEEFGTLESNILAEGCREPLSVWQRNDQLILVDGHNRYKICKKHDVPFKLKKLAFDDIQEVKVWMVDNQMGRRNLTPDQLSYYRGLRYLNLRKKKGGYDNVKAKGQADASTSEFLAGKFNVSESTVKRDAKFAEGLDIINRTNPGLKLKILTGEAKVKKGDVQILGNARNPEKISIRNEGDLHNKAKIIREEILEEVEGSINKLQKEKIRKAQDILDSTEPLFLKKEDRLRKIKGKIITAINRGIKDKDATAIKELKKLIDRLEDELFD